MAEEKENIIIINSGKYNGSIIKFSIDCVDKTSISITPETECNWVKFIVPTTSDDNIVKMEVDENTGAQREETFTVSYSIKGQTKSCEKSFTIVQKAKVDPCGMFIVDGGEENVDAQGKHKESGRYPCDSMLLLYSEQPEAHFDPAEASDWVNIEFVSWGDTTKTKDYNNYCTVYTDNPCVADYLLYQAGVVSEHMTCNSSTPLANFPQVVQDAVTGSTQYTNALGTIWYKVKPNPGEKRDFTISWTVGGKDCPPSKNLIIHQDAGSTPCKCTDLVVSGDKTIESDANTNIEIGTYTAGCVTDITASTSADWVTGITANTGSIKASVKGNTSTTKPNTATITVTGKAGTEICTKTFTLTQKAKESDPCDRFEVTGVEALPFYDATYTIANFTIDVATNIGVVNSTLPEWVLSSSVVVDNDNGKITAFIERYRNGKEPVREKEITVTGKVGTETCTKKFTLKQKKEYNRSCYRGTDNGADRYEDGSTRMRPTLLCGENGSYRQDSIYIENGDSGNLQYKLNGGSWMTFGGSGFDPAAWVHVGFDTIVGCCSNKFMKIVAQSQCNVSDCIPGEYYRSVKFSFRKKNYQEGDLVPQCAGTGTCDGPANEKLCDEWEYEIKQCAVGYYWAADSESMHSYNVYPAKCGSGKLVYWGCDCSTPVVCDCSALKVSDIVLIPSSGYEAETKLAKYTSDTSCGTVSKPTFVDGSGVDFVVWSTPTTTKLKGTVSKNETSSEKKATYKLTQGACNTKFEIKQEAGSEQGCDVSVTLSGDMDEGDTVKLKWGISQNLIDIGKNQTKTYHLNSNTEMIKATLSDPNNKYDLTPSTKTLKCSDNEMNVTASKKTTTCTCNNINITQQSVSFDYEGGSQIVGTISEGCVLSAGTDSQFSLHQEDTNIVASAKANESSQEKHSGIGYGIKDFDTNCGAIQFAQSAMPTKYNITVYGTQAETASGVKVSLAYTASPTLPSGAHFQFEDGCTLRINYWNCNGNTEYPIVPNNHVVPKCTPGSGGEYAIESGTRVQMETLSVNFSLFGETHHLTSGESGTYTNQGNTYIVAVQ